MMYGRSQPKIEEDSTDENGVRHVVVVQKWAPSRRGLGHAGIMAERPPTPVIGIPMVGPIRTTLRDGYLETRWFYGGGGDVSADFPLQTRELSTNYQFTPEWSDRDLTLHPLWPEYQSDYGATLNLETGRIEWPKNMPTSGAGVGFGLFAAASTLGMLPNPMYGRQTYEHLTGGTYQITYADKKFPPGLYARLSDIFKTGELPGGPPVFPGNEKRDWLKVIPEYRHEGDRYVITEYYKLSEIGGHPPQIYPPRKSK